MAHTVGEIFTSRQTPPNMHRCRLARKPSSQSGVEGSLMISSHHVAFRVTQVPSKEGCDRRGRIFSLGKNI